jgi:hypothetical protein
MRPTAAKQRNQPWQTACVADSERNRSTMKPVIFMASLAIASGIYPGTMALAPCTASATLVRAVAQHLPIGNPHHLPLNQSRAPRMAIGDRTAARACSACAYRGSNDNGTPRRRRRDLVAAAMTNVPTVKLPNHPTALPSAAGLPSA